MFLTNSVNERQAEADRPAHGGCNGTYISAERTHDQQKRGHSHYCRQYGRRLGVYLGKLAYNSLHLLVKCLLIEVSGSSWVLSLKTRD